MLSKIKLLLSFFLFSVATFAQNPVLIGYWQNWNDANAPYISLDLTDTRYNVVCVSFAVPTSPSDLNMQFVPEVVTQNEFIAQIQTLKNQGRKVLLSIGGANTSISLPDVASKNAFINSMNLLLETYPFDGIDIDIEHGNTILASGNIQNPTSIDCTNLIEAIQEIKAHYATVYNQTMMLTFAPETAYVQGGMSAYGGIWGGYLPLLNALRNDINFLHVQLYNSGTVYGIDANIYTQGTADFIVALTEAVIQGFNTAGGQFSGFPANKIVVGLPACPSAAGGGFTNTETVAAAIGYLHGNGIQPGSYTLQNINGYPDLAGMMTWSINWDNAENCNATTGEYANNFQELFDAALQIETHPNEETNLEIFPNPVSNSLTIANSVDETILITNTTGQIVYVGKNEKNEINTASLRSGIYFIFQGDKKGKFIRM